MKRKHINVVAEIGCNHMGNINIAKEMVKIAAQECGVDAVKFQKRCIKELLSPAQYDAPHPHPENAYGESYGRHREALEFDLNQHKEIKAYCDELNIVYSSSVWDLTSAKEITSLNPQFIKIPSATNTNYSMLCWLCDNYSGEIHVSLGMTSRFEEEKIVELFIKKNRNNDLALYACTFGYPVPSKDTCILEIKRLQETYGNIVKKVGYSGHHIGVKIDNAIAVLMPDIIERHFTLNHDWKGTDHKASLQPEEMKELIDKDLENEGVQVDAGLNKHLYEYFGNACCVIGINSTALYEALAFGIPVYVYANKYGVENLLELSKNSTQIHLFKDGKDSIEKLKNDRLINPLRVEDTEDIFASNAMERALSALETICGVIPEGNA